MSPEDVTAALEAMQVWRSPFQVHLTGGEPFLNFPLGIPCTLEPNTGWCVNLDLTRWWFTELSQTGLQVVQIRVSPFHAAHIPLRAPYWLCAAPRNSSAPK
jgi:hypothetical protein